MNLVVLDFSTTAKAHRIVRRQLSLLLHRFSKRIFCGRLPQRTINQVHQDLRSSATKATSVVFLVSSNSSPTGFRVKLIGSRKNTGLLQRFDPSIRSKIIKTSKQIDKLLKSLAKRT